jgi:hypothetical protein
MLQEKVIMTKKEVRPQPQGRPIEDVFSELERTRRQREKTYAWPLIGWWFKFYDDKLYPFYFDVIHFQPFAELKWFFQRGRRGWSDRDCWCLHAHIAKVLVDSLTHLKKIKIGIPAHIQKKGMTDDEGVKIWDDILDNMIYTFDIVLKAGDDQVCLYSPRKDVQAFYKKHDYNMLTKEDTQRFYNGFKLLSKYIFHLWD